MSMLFALHGAEFGATADPSVRALQTVLKALGTGIGDATLKAIVTDGLMGPKTTAATNRALTVHIGSGQAGPTLRTGNLTQGAILKAITSIISILTIEANRRGIGVPTAKKVVSPTSAARTASVTIPSGAPAQPAFVAPTTTPLATVPTAPTYAPPAGTPAPGGLDTTAILKWSAVGLGIVTLAGVAYWFVSRRQSPALGSEESPAYGLNGSSNIKRIHYDKATKLYYGPGQTPGFINVSFEPGMPSQAHIESRGNQQIAFIYKYDNRGESRMIPVGAFPKGKAGRALALQAIENARFA